MRRTIVIGAGGAGLTVVREMSQQDDNINTIAIDFNDSEELIAIEEDKDDGKLDKLEVISLEYGDDGEDGDHLNDRLKRGKPVSLKILGKEMVFNKLESGRIYPYTGELDGKDFSVKGGSGVGRCRTKMDFLLYEKKSNFEKIHTYFSKLYHDEFDTGLHPERLDEKINFWIICGGAGGTGSGLLCGIGKIIRSIFLTKCTIFVVLVLPNGPRHLDATAVSNSYCLLREIEYLRNKRKKELEELARSVASGKVENKENKKVGEEIFRTHLLKSGEFFDNITMISFKNKFSGINENFAREIIDEDVIPSLIRCLSYEIIMGKKDEEEKSKKGHEDEEDEDDNIEEDIDKVVDKEEELEIIHNIEKDDNSKLDSNNKVSTLGFKMNDFFKFQKGNIYGTIAFSQTYMDVIRIKRYFKYKDSLEELIKIRNETTQLNIDYDNLVNERKSKHCLRCLYGIFSANLNDKIVSVERDLENKYEKALKIKIPVRFLDWIKENKAYDKENIRIITNPSNTEENDKSIALKIEIFTDLLTKQLEIIKTHSKIGIVSTYPILFEKEERTGRKYLDNDKIKSILDKLYQLDKENKLENYTLSNIINKMGENANTYIDGRVANLKLGLSSFKNLAGDYDQDYPLVFKTIVAHDDTDVMRRYMRSPPKNGVDGDAELRMLHVLDEESKNSFPRANWTMISLISGYNLEDSKDYIELKEEFEKKFDDTCLDHICIPEAFEDNTDKKDGDVKKKDGEIKDKDGEVKDKDDVE